MTSPHDPFTARFGADGLRRFAAASSDAGLPDVNAPARVDGLVLPHQVGPYFHTLDDEPATLSAYADSIGAELSTAEQRSWARLGSDRAYDLVADPNGQVHALLIRYADEPLRYVSSSPRRSPRACSGSTNCSTCSGRRTIPTRPPPPSGAARNA